MKHKGETSEGNHATNQTQSGRQVKEIMRPTGPSVEDKRETNERQMGDK